MGKLAPSNIVVVTIVFVMHVVVGFVAICGHVALAHYRRVRASLHSARFHAGILTYILVTQSGSKNTTALLFKLVRN